MINTVCQQEMYSIDTCIQLNSYAVKMRYPTRNFDLQDYDAVEALYIAKDIMNQADHILANTKDINSNLGRLFLYIDDENVATDNIALSYSGDALLFLKEATSILIANGKTWTINCDRKLIPILKEAKLTDARIIETMISLSPSCPEKNTVKELLDEYNAQKYGREQRGAKPKFPSGNDQK